MLQDIVRCQGGFANRARLRVPVRGEVRVLHGPQQALAELLVAH